jgi:hypothetical protein
MTCAWFGLNSLPGQDVKNKAKDLVGYWWLQMIGVIGAGKRKKNCGILYFE